MQRVKVHRGCIRQPDPLTFGSYGERKVRNYQQNANINAGSFGFHKRMIDRSAIDNREGRNATRTIVQHTWYTCIFIACKKVKIYIKRSVRINYSIDFRIGSEKSIFYARLKCSDSFSVNSPEFRKGRQSQRTFAYNSDISNLGDVTLTQVIKARMWLMICKLRDYANNVLKRVVLETTNRVKSFRVLFNAYSLNRRVISFLAMRRNSPKPIEEWKTSGREKQFESRRKN